MNKEPCLIGDGELFFHDVQSGNWSPMNNGATAKVSFMHSIGITSTLLAVNPNNNDVLLKIAFDPNVTYDPVPSQPLFHRIYDGCKYWGINFFESTIADQFLNLASSILENSGGTTQQKHSSVIIGQSSSQPIAQSKRPLSMKSVSKAPPPMPKLGTNPSTKAPATAPKTISKINSPFLNSQPKGQPNPKGPGKVPPLNGKLSPQPTLKKITRPLVNQTGSQPNSPRKVGETKILSLSLPPTNELLRKNRPHSTSNPKVPNGHSPHMNGSSNSPPQNSQTDTSSRTAPAPFESHRSSARYSTTQTGLTDKDVREKIIDEIIKTESDYVDSLNILRDMYYLPLKYSPRMGVNIFKPGDFEKIFYGLDTILLLNKELLNELKIKKSSGLLYNQCGKVLNVFVPSMKLYIDYVNKFDDTLKLIKEYEDNNDTFRKLLQQNMEDMDCQLRGLQDFLIMPIQRIPRYVLLLQQLKGRTEESHEDYNEISKALQTIESIAGYINNQKKDYEDKAKVTMIQQRLNPKGEPLLKEGRLLIWSGILYIKNPAFVPPKKPIKKKPNKEPQPESLGLKEIEVFLLNDLIFMAEKDPKHSYLNEIRRIDLWDVRSCDSNEQYSVPFYPIDDDKYKSFKITVNDNSDIPLLYAEQKVVHAKWISVINQETRDAIRKKSEELNRKAKAKHQSIL